MSIALYTLEPVVHVSKEKGEVYAIFLGLMF